MCKSKNDKGILVIKNPNSRIRTQTTKNGEASHTAAQEKMNVNDLKCPWS